MTFSDRWNEMDFVYQFLIVLVIVTAIVGILGLIMITFEIT
jgi:hypothetical protein